MINPSRQQVKKAIRRLARMTGLTIAQVRPTFTSGAHRAGVVNLVQNTRKFEKQTSENISTKCDFLIINQSVWLAIPHSASTIVHSERGLSNPKLVESWEAFHKLFPNYPGVPHVK